MKLLKQLFDRKTDIHSRLNDYVLRSINLYNRDINLQQRFGSPDDPAFKKYIDTEAILYIREIQEVGLPFPPWQEMLTVGGETDLRLFLSIGYECFESVLKYIPSDIGFPFKILDFGVGCGRTMRFFYRELDQFDCYGCDVDHRAIQYLKRSIPFVKAIITKNLPPLPYLSNMMDLVYSISVFTHLNISAFNVWLQEMHRILKAGGGLEMSLHGTKSFELVCSEPQRRNLIGISENEFASNQERFYKDGFVWMKQPVSSSDIDTSQFGISFISQAYLERVIAPYFTLSHYAVGELGGWQDLAVLRKKA